MNVLILIPRISSKAHLEFSNKLQSLNCSISLGLKYFQSDLIKSIEKSKLSQHITIIVVRDSIHNASMFRSLSKWKRKFDNTESTVSSYKQLRIKKKNATSLTLFRLRVSQAGQILKKSRFMGMHFIRSLEGQNNRNNQGKMYEI